MSEDQAAARPSRRRQRARTWSELGDLGRKPTRYEIVTHGMNHTMGDTPLELGPDVNGNEWLRTHRDASAITGVDWDAFRDPDELTYESYCVTQDDAETYIDASLRRFDASDRSDQHASAELLAYLARAMTPTRYMVHGIQMLSAYVQQLAPSSYVANCASFQTADQLRRIQRIAERTKMLQLTHPAARFGIDELAAWQEHEDWQAIRRIVEEALVEYDWDKAFVATNLVVKPLVDAVFLDDFAIEARTLGGDLDALIAENLSIDAQRSRRWTSALVQHMVAQNPDSDRIIQDQLNRWLARASEVTAAAARLVATGEGRSAVEIADAATLRWQEFLRHARAIPVAG